MSNRAKLKSVYPDVILANDHGKWHVNTNEDVKVKFKTKRVLNDPRLEQDGEYVDGSFMWYLNISGSYVKTIAMMILYATQNDLALINKIYPQMVAAYKSRNWLDTPDGFRYDTYNSYLKVD